MAIHACFKCFICFRHMLQSVHLDVLKVDLGEAHTAAASAPPWVTVLPWVAACAWWWCCCVYAGCVKWSRLGGGPRVCVGPRGLKSRIGAGAREVRVSGADAGAPSDASVPDRTSER
jgi:hypothetical protein